MEPCEGSLIMDSALLVISAFSGLLAAFVGSAVWATRPHALTTERLMRRERTEPRLR